MCNEDMVRNAVEGSGGRRRAPREALARTDHLLGVLEELNLEDRGAHRLPRTVGREVEEIRALLSPQAQTRFTGCRTVQEYLDATFDVQEELLGACAWAARLDAGWDLPLARAS
jgi:hypothetical protein